MTDGILCTLNFAPDLEKHSAESTFRRLFSQLRKFCGLGTPTPSPTSPPTPLQSWEGPRGPPGLLGRPRVGERCAAGAAERRVLARRRRLCLRPSPPPAAAAAPRFIPARPTRAGAFP